MCILWRWIIALWFVHTIALLYTVTLLWVLLDWIEWSLYLHNTARSSNRWFWSSVNWTICNLDWVIIVIFLLSIIRIQVDLWSTHLIWRWHHWSSGYSHWIYNWSISIFLCMLIWLWKLIVILVFLHLVLIGCCHDSNAIAWSWLWVSIIRRWWLSIGYSTLESISSLSHWPTLIILLRLILLRILFVVSSEGSVIQVTLRKLISLSLVRPLLIFPWWWNLTASITLSWLLVNTTSLGIGIHVFLVHILDFLRSKLLLITLMKSTLNRTIVTMNLISRCRLSLLRALHNLCMLLDKSWFKSITFVAYISNKLLFSVITSHV